MVSPASSTPTLTCSSRGCATCCGSRARLAAWATGRTAPPGSASTSTVLRAIGSEPSPTFAVPLLLPSPQRGEGRRDSLTPWGRGRTVTAPSTRMRRRQGVSKRIAMISEHASPLGVLGGVDSGGQNVYVGQLARNLAALGYEVDLFTRRDSDRLPEIADWVSGIRIIHVPAGPPAFVRKEDMLPFMGDFSTYLQQFFRCQREAYDLVHANFWMSGLVATELKRALGVPFVITFH